MSLLAVFVVIAGFAVWATRRKRAVGKTRRKALAAVIGVLALQALVGAPALAQDPGGQKCPDAPTPERAGAGLVGAIDPAAGVVGSPGGPYEVFGYAGMVWHTYDLGCVASAIDPAPMVDTWVGNELFNIGKTVVAATNGLHYALQNQSLLKPLDDVVSDGTIALYDSVFAPWFGLVAVILATILFRYIWKGDLASIGKRGMWLLAALWFATATYSTPLLYTQALDSVIIGGTTQMQAGFLDEARVSSRNNLPETLHYNVVYQNWLRGEFGSPTSRIIHYPQNPQGRDSGMALLEAQAWSKEDVKHRRNEGDPRGKRQAFRDIAGQLGPEYGTFTGRDSSRIGTGALAAVQGLAFASFQFLAKVAILLAQVMLRVIVLAGPILGLVAILYHPILRAVGRIAGAALLNAVMLAAMAGLHTMILTWIFNPRYQLSVLTQILLAALVTAIFLIVGRPVRRMGQLVELTLGDFGQRTYLPKMLSFLRSRSGTGGRQDAFWESVRGQDFEDSDLVGRETSTARAGMGMGGVSRGRSARPEGEQPSIVVPSERLDRGSQRPALPFEPPSHASGSAAPALPAAGSAALGEAQRAMAAREGWGGDSRVVDSPSITDLNWTNTDGDPVLVPSRSGMYQQRSEQVSAAAFSSGSSGVADQAADRSGQQSIRDTEVIQGRSVRLVYRPSRGLEVADTDSFASNNDRAERG